MSDGYYDQSYPPSLWENPVVNPTGATAGSPGSFTPPGATLPATVAAMNTATPPIVASPATGWTAGQYVQTATAGLAGQATWSGASYVGYVPTVQEQEHEEEPQQVFTAIPVDRTEVEGDEESPD